MEKHEAIAYAREGDLARSREEAARMAFDGNGADLVWESSDTGGRRAGRSGLLAAI